MTDEQSIAYWRDRAVVAEAHLKSEKKEIAFIVSWIKRNAPDTFILLNAAKDINQYIHAEEILNRFPH